MQQFLQPIPLFSFPTYQRNPSRSAVQQVLLPSHIITRSFHPITPCPHTRQPLHTAPKSAFLTSNRALSNLSLSLLHKSLYTYIPHLTITTTRRDLYKLLIIGTRTRRVAASREKRSSYYRGKKSALIVVVYRRYIIHATDSFTHYLLWGRASSVWYRTSAACSASRFCRDPARQTSCRRLGSS